MSERRGLLFTDISEDENYRDAVVWALETGITTGTGPVTFLYRVFK